MNTLKSLTTFTISFFLFACNFNPDPNMLTPPRAKQIPKEITTHNHTRIDKYYWLNQRENPEVIAYLEQENAYTEQGLAHTKKFQEKLFNEIKGKIKEDDESVPYLKNGYYYYTRYVKGGEYPIIARKKGSLESEEEILLNVNEMAEGYDYYQVGSSKVSTNNNILAYSVDTVSRRIYSIYFKNLETNELLEDVIPNTTGSVVWANDNKTVFYTKKDETLRAYKIFKHTLGTDILQDEEVFHEEDATFNCGISKSKSGDFLFIGSYSTVSSEVRFIDANKPNGKWKVIEPRKRDHLYYVDHFEDSFYIRTNNNDAKNYRLVKTLVSAPQATNWAEIIAHRPDILLEDFELFKNYMVLTERHLGLNKLRVFDFEQKKDFYIDFNDPAYTAYSSTNLEFDTPWFRYGYTSLTTPNSVYEFNMETGEQVLLKQTEVVGGHNPDEYESERLWATAKDGTQVPISLVYKKNVYKKDGTAPLLLYGYGSYGYSLDPYFSISRLSLLDRGFAFAIAHIRGGEELGRDWYENGKLLKKKNTFTDFIACGQFLVKENYAAHDKLFASGGSAGGLLMGAVINMKPEMWAGVVADVPFVDVVTTMLDESIPLTTGEFDEWGNPKNKEYYFYMLAYSPYDQVERKKYPPLLVITGLHDSQVQYWEPAKWVAKLRTLKTDNNPLYLKTDMSAGHGGASGRFESLRDVALEYAFLLDLAGKMDKK
jgi:oligopeptidase B